jgi:hypothetical protein
MHCVISIIQDIITYDLLSYCGSMENTNTLINIPLLNESNLKACLGWKEIWGEGGGGAREGKGARNVLIFSKFRPSSPLLSLY